MFYEILLTILFKNIYNEPVTNHHWFQWERKKTVEYAGRMAASTRQSMGRSADTTDTV